MKFRVLGAPLVPFYPFAFLGSHIKPTNRQKFILIVIMVLALNPKP